MKKILLLFFSIILLVTFSPPALAQKKSVILPKSQTINKDYFAAGDNVILQGTINGDAYIAGGNVLVDGDINGDLLIAGGNITINGNVKHNIRAIGGTINFYGPVGGNVTVAGGQVSIAESAKIMGSLAAASGNIIILAPVSKDLNIAAGQVNIDNAVGGDVNAAVDHLSLFPQANIHGNLTYWSSNNIDEQSGSTVSGNITKKYIPVQKTEEVRNNFNRFVSGFVALFKTTQAIGLFIVGFLILKIMPSYFNRTVEITLKRPWRNILVGLIALIVTPIAGIMLLFTFIGIPIAFILFIIYLVIIYLSKIFISYIVGQKLLEYLKLKLSQPLTLLIGIIVLSILTFIPIIGGFIGLFVLLLGVGGILVEEKGFYNLLRDKKLI